VKKLYYFNETFRDLDNGYFTGRRGAVNKLNLTYLYTNHSPKLTHKDMKELKLKNDDIWCSWYSIPRESINLSNVFYFLTLPYR